MVTERRNLNFHDQKFFEFNASYFPDNVIEGWIIRGQGENLTARNEKKYHKTLSALDIASNRTLFGTHGGKGLFPALEVSYHFGRLVDDMNDGDTPLPEGFTDFKELVLYLKEKIGDTSPKVGRGGAVEFLMKRSFVRLKAMRGTNEKEIMDATDMFLTGMLVENIRRENGGVFTKDGLTALYRVTFEPSQDISLIALRSKVRSKDIPELAIVQGKSYTFDGLEKEIEAGICNIPDKVLEEAGVSREEVILNPTLITSSPVFIAWRNKEKEECLLLLEDLKKRKLDIPARLLVFHSISKVKKRFLNSG